MQAYPASLDQILTLNPNLNEVFTGGGNIYESYLMTGERGGDTGGNYLEHCAGFAWSVTEGVFGLDFASDIEAAATVTPRFDPAWPTARGSFRLRGVDIEVAYDGNSTAGVTLRALDTGSDARLRAPVHVRLVWGDNISLLKL